MVGVIRTISHLVFYMILCDFGTSHTEMCNFKITWHSDIDNCPLYIVFGSSENDIETEKGAINF